MKIEELKLIIELLATLGEHGKEAFYWWLIFDKGLGFLGFLIAVVIVVVAVYKGFTYVQHQDDNEHALRSLRDAMGVGTEGIIIRGEINAMHAWVNKRKAEMK